VSTLNYRELKKLLYRLKRIWGQPISVRRPLTNTHNVETGAISRTYTTYSIDRAIIMPISEARKFKYSLSYVAGNKNFTYGGFYDQQSRFLILDKADVDIIPNADDNIQISGDIYIVVTTETYEDDRAIYLLIRRMPSDS